MGDLSVNFLLFKEKNMFKIHYMKSNHRVPVKKVVDTYEAPVFTPNYSATVSSAKICTYSNEHAMYIRFL